MPIDRYYIEKFLASHAEDVRGHVLEVKDNAYTKRFGGNRVERSDVVSLTHDDGVPTIVADLTRADHIPSDTYDCIILTQTLQLIYELRNALETLHRILKPGGTLLVTVPGISKIASEEKSDCWRLTTLSWTRLFQEIFPEDSVTVTSYGNVLAALGFLEGLATKELTASELEFHDPDFEVINSIRAVKPTRSV